MEIKKNGEERDRERKEAGKKRRIKGRGKRVGRTGESR